MADELRDKKILQEEFNRAIEAELNIQQDITSQLKEALEAAQVSQEIRRRMVSNSRNLATIYNNIAADGKRIANLDRTREKSLKDQEALQRSINKLTISQNNIQEQIDQQLRTIPGHFSTWSKEEQAKGKALTESLLIIQEQIKATQNLTKELEHETELYQRIENQQTGILKFVRDFMGSIPGLKALTGPFDDAAEASKNITKEAILANDELDRMAKAGIKGGSVATGPFAGMTKQLGTGAINVKKMQAGAKAFGKGLTSSVGIASALGMIIAKIVQAFFKADKQSVAISRTLGLTAEQAEVYRDRIIETASRGLTTAVANTENLLKAQFKLNELLGFSVSTDDIRLKQLTDINERLGLSEGSLKRLVNLASLVNNTELGILETAGRIQREFEITNMVFFNGREILEETLSLSEGIQQQFGYSVENMMEAVLQAKLLGFTLDDIAKTQSSLLQFESSISNELEAELLVGRELNLERARYFALTKDLNSLQKELGRELGTQEDFLKLNIVQQESLARSVGITVEELSNALLKQEQVSKIQKINNDLGLRAVLKQQLGLKENEQITEEIIQNLASQGKLTDDLTKLLGEEYVESLKREDAMQRFGRAMDSLNDILIRLVEGGALDKIATGIEQVALALSGGQSFASLMWSGVDQEKVMRSQAEMTGSRLDEVQRAKLDEIMDAASATAKEHRKLKWLNFINPAQFFMHQALEEATYRGTQSTIDREFPVQDFVLKTHPQDKVIAMGGTAIEDHTLMKEMVGYLKELTMLSKAGTTIELDGVRVGEALNRNAFKT